MNTDAFKADLTPEEAATEADRLRAIRVPGRGPRRTLRVHKQPAHSERFTTTAEAMAALYAKMQDQPPGQQLTDIVHCTKCRDSGFTEIDDDGRGTVRHCPAGCRPPRPRAAIEPPAPPTAVARSFD